MSKPYHIYLDLDVLNSDTAPTSRAPVLSFEETRTQPFLEGSASDYFVSIVRFSIQTGTSLPVFIPRIATGATDNPTNDINKTIYKITMTYEEATHAEKTSSVSYTPCNEAADLPRPPNDSGQDLSESYYYVKNYQDWISMINKTLKEMWISAELGVQTGDLPYPPYMELNPETYMVTLYAPKFYFDQRDIAPPTLPRMRLYFNTRLYELFTSLPNTFVSYSGDKNYLMRIESSNLNTVLITSTNSRYISVPQELCTIGMWNPVASIAFTSTTLPVAQTLTGVPKQLTSSSDGMVGSGAPNVINILSDFEIPVSAANQYRPEISYVPQAEYRLVDMYENSDLRKVDISVFWKDRFGNLNPFRLQPGCAASLKLLFRHKHFYLGMD